MDEGGRDKQTRLSQSQEEEKGTTTSGDREDESGEQRLKGQVEELIPAEKSHRDMAAINGDTVPGKASVSPPATVTKTWENAKREGG